MVIKADKAKLKDILSLCKQALPKASVQEERSHVLLKFESGRLTVSATNGDTKIALSMDATGDTNGEFTIDPKIVERLGAKIDAEEITLELDSEKGLKMSTGPRSFAALKTFPTDRVLKVAWSDDTGRESVEINNPLFTAALCFCGHYLAAITEDAKTYDYIIIHKGVARAANGSNKLGFLASTELEKVENWNLRKSAVPAVLSFSRWCGESPITLYKTDKELGVESQDKSARLSCLRSTHLPADVKATDYLSSEKPFLKINQKNILKALDRLAVSAGSTVDLGVELTPIWDGEASRLDITSLVVQSKSIEAVPCVGQGEGTKDIRVAQQRILKTIFTSLGGDDGARLHFDSNPKFFKGYSVGKINDKKYFMCGIGAYSKVVKNG